MLDRAAIRANALPALDRTALDDAKWPVHRATSVPKLAVVLPWMSKQAHLSLTRYHRSMKADLHVAHEASRETTPL